MKKIREKKDQKERDEMENNIRWADVSEECRMQEIQFCEIENKGDRRQIFMREGEEEDVKMVI